MAYDKVVDSAALDAGLTSVADAIREKGGTSASLAFPQGFVDAIGNISVGGEDNLPTVISGGTLGDYVDNTSTKLRQWAFYFYKGITSFSSNSLERVDGACFRYCSNLESINLPNLTSAVVGGDNFANCSKLSGIVLPKISKFSTDGGDFNGNANFVYADFGGVANIIPKNTFINSSKFGLFVLRSHTLIPLANINAFSNTLFASGKSGGTLYVPSSLIYAYQSETNWSTILGYATNSIQAIEGSQYETHYADGTVIPT
jgi:hypothetical protein